MGIHLLACDFGPGLCRVVMVHDYVNPARWSKQNAFLEPSRPMTGGQDHGSFRHTDVRLLRRIGRRRRGLFPEVRMPQPGETRIETLKINSWLKNHAGWPLRCIVLLAMRTRLSAATLMPSAMSASNSAYSAAEAPSSSFINRRMTFNMICTFLLCNVMG